MPAFGLVFGGRLRVARSPGCHAKGGRGVPLRSVLVSLQARTPGDS